MTNYKELKCIKHNRTTEDGSFTDYLTFNQFKDSFVIERWENEERTGQRMTLFGTYHNRAEIKQERQTIVHTFIFPASMEEAKALHQQNTKS